MFSDNFVFVNLIFDYRIIPFLSKIWQNVNFCAKYLIIKFLDTGVILNFSIGCFQFLPKFSNLTSDDQMKFLYRTFENSIGFLPEFGLERFIDKFNEKISIITSEMKSYTYHFFTGENMVNNSSMCKHPTALTRISTQTFLFNQRSYKKGIRQIKMAKAAIFTGPRRKLAVNLFCSLSLSWFMSSLFTR